METTASTTPLSRRSAAYRSLPAYVLPDSSLGMGASLGNGSVWIHTKNTGAVERVFSTALGQNLVGTISLRYGGLAFPLAAARVSHRDDPSAIAYIGLRPDGPRRTFEIHPAYQRVTYTVAGSIAVSETTFVALSGGDAALDPPVVYQLVELANRDQTRHQMRVVASARLRGSTPADVRAIFDERLSAIVAWNESMASAVRIFGLTVSPTRYDTNFDFGSVYDPSHVHALGDSTGAFGDVLGQLQLDLELQPGEIRRFCVKTGVFARGLDDAAERYQSAPDPEAALRRTIAHLEDCLQASQVLTPDAVINEGALWSKVNMRRVMASYPQGCAFTNDPGASSAVVVRDAAWFVYGNDFFLPAFSRSLLENIRKRQYPNGKLPEFYHAVNGDVEDDGLNINDDTPLYILAVSHHVRATGDAEWLRSMYGSVCAAVDYIISQVDSRGLVFCSAKDPRGNVWAIASWRNIIPLYTINGAVAEINAECVAALRDAAQMAAKVERDDDAERFASFAERIAGAMNTHLINPDNGLYYLNIDADGNVHTDVTGDEIFPVMFGVCDEETGFRIISRLNAPDFWTSAGLRTASRNDPFYDPSSYAGLLGGVWPGLTWWYAFAAARYHPSFMVRALRSSFEHYAADPKKNNTVPGQFSEWFDGESLTNKGMRLSPWEPPRFLWAAVEGVCGLTLTHGMPCISPLVPENWTWVGLRRIPYHLGEFSYFAVRRQGGFHIYSTAPARSESNVHVYEEDVSDQVGVFAEAGVALALQRKGQAVVLLGNVGSTTANIAMNIAALVDPASVYRLRVYDSERQDWEEFGKSRGRELAGLAFSVETQGFRLLEITRSE